MGEAMTLILDLLALAVLLTGGIAALLVVAALVQ